MKKSNHLPKRKKIRLDGFDYSSNGSYFVTICVKDENTSLWSRVGADETVGIQASRKINPAEIIFDSITDSDAVYNDIWEYINNNPRKMHKGFKY